MSLSLQSNAAIGSDRFLIQQKLGSGAFGDVFRAYDHRLETVVALKTLHRAEPAAIYHFKNEFRSLAGVTHPNLVQLFELLSEDERWFFTMELVEGLDFIEYAGPTGGKKLTDTTEVHPLPAPTVRHDFERLRRCLRQLSEGLCALHRAGKLHCDIKPTNVRVTTEGRLVLLDFGLVHDMASQAFQTMVGEVRGTPAYMSPEQAVGGGVSEASDWYAVGGVLYEALTGELPFNGTALDVLKAKQIADGPSPRKRVPYLPDDLAGLCECLLVRQPEKRPIGEQVLDRLGGGWVAVPEIGATVGTGPFIGREMQLAALHEALDRTLEGATGAVFVRGAQGLGKTALVGRFIEQASRRYSDLVVLAGRCYEQETMPYKGLDALIDNLSRYLKHLPYDEAAALIPDHGEALMQLFPALLRVDAVATTASRQSEPLEGRRLRRSVRSALLELFHRLGQRAPLLLFIDDLQWGDQDSAKLLASLLTGAEPPPLLLVGCHGEGGGEGRAGDPGEERGLRHLLSRKATGNVEVREIEVKELWFSEACELALKLLGERRSPALSLARAIARESAGSPLFIAEMVRYALADPGSAARFGQPEDVAPSGLSLESLVRSRLDRLPADARRLLEIIAIAGRPLALEIAFQAAEVEAGSQVALKTLLAGSLVRLFGSPERALETHHGHIREAVLEGLDEDRQAALHGRLATALEVTRRVDSETLVKHFCAAGDRPRAIRIARDSAREAMAQHGFEKAVRLYRVALELEVDSVTCRSLQMALGEALVSAGRRPEAAQAFLAAAEARADPEALALRRRACEQQFFGGDFDGCQESVRAVLASIGVPVPRSSPTAVLWHRLWVLWHRFWVRLRALRRLPKIRPARAGGLQRAGIDRSAVRSGEAAERWRLEALWSAIAVYLRNPHKAIELAARYQNLASRAEDPSHRLRALALEAALSASGGVRNIERSQSLLATIGRLVGQVDEPRRLAELSFVRGFVALFESRVEEASQQLARAELLWQESSPSDFWGASRTPILRLYALLLQGRYGEVAECLTELLRDGTAKGNLYDETDLRSRASWVVRLAADQPSEASKELYKAQALVERQLTSDLWSYTGFHRLHYEEVLGRVEVALYRGRSLEAWRLVEGLWPKLRRSFAFRVQIVRVEARGLYCRAALAAAVALGSDSATGSKLRRRVQKMLRRLEAEKLDWASALGRSILAGCATLMGETAAAIESSKTAAAAFEAAGFELYAAANRYRLGQLLASGGRDLRREAAEWMGGQGIRRPEKMVNVLAPGLWPEVEPVDLPGSSVTGLSSIGTWASDKVRGAPARPGARRSMKQLSNPDFEGDRNG
ncbi:MAG: AAA family ATPase [Acidobacteriota bacterium]